MGLRPQARTEPSRTVLVVVALCVGLGALVNPKGPGHMAPVDGLMLIGLVVVFAWVVRNRVPLRLPYLVPVTGLMATGLVAALFSVSPSGGLQAVVQESFLVLWCAAVAMVCRTTRALGLLLRVWAGSAIGWAALLILAVATGQKWLSGAGSVANGTSDLSGLSEGTRARLFFDHPNMAGNYFMVAIFVVVAAGYPRRLSVRVSACAVLGVAMFLTGSNAALLSLLGGAVVAVFLHVRAHRGTVTATAAVAVLLMVGGVGWFEVAAPIVATAQQSANPLLRNSVGRGERSAEARQSLFASQFQIFERGDLLGIGPAGTRSALGAEGATAVHEAHNDYLGTLVERGPLGLLAVLGLVGVVAARLVRISGRPLPPRLQSAVPVPAALTGACVAFALTALTHEILHYRWLWTLLAIVAAVHLLARAEPGRDGAAAERTTTPGGVRPSVPASSGAR